MTRFTRVLIKVGWTALVVAAMAVMSTGLARTVYFEPTDAALADERSGQVLVVAASVMIVGLGVFARYLFATSKLVPWALIAAATTCIFVTFTGMIALVAFPIAYPLVVAAVITTLLTPPNNRPRPKP